MVTAAATDCLGSVLLLRCTCRQGHLALTLLLQLAVLVTLAVLVLLMYRHSRPVQTTCSFPRL
jgi:hypothetical protein